MPCIAKMILEFLSHISHLCMCTGNERWVVDARKRGGI